VLNDLFYLVDSDRWIPLRNESAFSRLLDSKEDKKAFNSFISQNRIKIRKFQDEDLTKAAQAFVKLRTERK